MHKNIAYNNVLVVNFLQRSLGLSGDTVASLIPKNNIGINIYIYMYNIFHNPKQNCCSYNQDIKVSKYKY